MKKSEIFFVPVFSIMDGSDSDGIADDEHGGGGGCRGES